MTIKDLLDITPEGITVKIGWDGYIVPVDLGNNLIVDAFGDYVIQRLQPVSYKEIEATLKAEPVKAK